MDILESRYATFHLRRDFALEAGFETAVPERLVRARPSRRLIVLIGEGIARLVRLRRNRGPSLPGLAGFGMLVPPGQNDPVPCIVSGSAIRRVDCPGLFAELEQRVRAVTGVGADQRSVMSASVQATPAPDWVKPRYLVLQFKDEGSAALVGCASALRLLGAAPR